MTVIAIAADLHMDHDAAGTSHAVQPDVRSRTGDVVVAGHPGGVGLGCSLTRSMTASKSFIKFHQTRLRFTLRWSTRMSSRASRWSALLTQALSANGAPACARVRARGDLTLVLRCPWQRLPAGSFSGPGRRALRASAREPAPARVLPMRS
jgi:hypothetical protein